MSEDIKKNSIYLNVRIDKLESESQRRHDEVISRFDGVVDELHDEGKPEFTRDKLE